MNIIKYTEVHSDRGNLIPSPHTSHTFQNLNKQTNDITRCHTFYMASVEQRLQNILPTAVSLSLSEHNAPKLLDFY